MVSYLVTLHRKCGRDGCLQSESLAKTFSEMSEGSLTPTELMALTLRMYSFSGMIPSSTRYFSSFTGRELTLIHFSVPASHISMWYPLMGQPPSCCGGFQEIDRKSLLAPVTCSSMGGDGTPVEGGTDRLRFHTLLSKGINTLLVTGPTCWILNGQDLSGFTRVSDTGLVLSTNLELNLCSFDDICHFVLTVWT